MCFGGGGVNEAVIKQQQQQSATQQQAAQQAMAQFQQQQAQQSQAYQAQVAQQIAGITADTQRMQDEYESDLAAQEAAQAAADASAYITSTQEGEFTDDVLTTGETKTVDKSKSTLKIASGGVKSTAGAGLNIGV